MVAPVAAEFTEPRPDPSFSQQGGERRAHLRWLPNQDTPGRLQVEQDETHLWARVLDVSRSGVGLLLSRRLSPGTQILLELRDARQNRHRCLRGRVVHVKELDHGSFMTGSRLEQDLREEDLDNLFA